MDFNFVETEEYKLFIKQYKDFSPDTLRLKNFKSIGFDIDFAITQIVCQNKAKAKLPELYDKILFPTDISIEQCTTETIAEFHGSLFKGCKSVIDFTCGLGIDSYFISKNVQEVTSYDINPQVASVANENCKRLNANNIRAFQGDSLSVAMLLDLPVSACFIDPSRRNKTDLSSRLYSLSDCEPNVELIINAIKDKSDFLIVKASPMIDITQTIKTIENISDIWIISIKNDCKELLFRADFKNKSDKINIHTLNFEQGHIETFDSIYGQDDMPISFAAPSAEEYLYIPNSSVMKANLFKSLLCRYNISKIAPNSHLFTGNSVIKDFPGKVYYIKNVFGLSKSEILSFRRRSPKANIACRNFPLSPEALRNKLKIKDGGDVYIFATTTADNRHILIECEKVNI